MLSRDCLSCGPPEAFSPAEEVEARLKVLPERPQDRLACQFCRRVEWRRGSLNAPGRYEGQTVRYTADRASRLDNRIVIDDAGAALHLRIIGDLQNFGEDA